MAAYSGLHCVVPKDKPLDRAGARVMCGICHNLQGRQLYDTPPPLPPVLTGRVSSLFPF
jgi:hypothetical protein